MELNNQEARVIGCLLEKEITTPEQYPLSANSLTLACNQKSSREPVMSMTESEVQQIIDELIKNRLISEQSGFGSRVAKYKHRFCNTEFSDLQLSSEQLAIIIVMMLRGPQTPGELKTRCNRLHTFETPQQVESALQALASREEPLVVQLPREAGRRDNRYAQLFSDKKYLEQGSTQFEASVAAPNSDKQALITRVDVLENQISDLTKRLEELEQLLD
ncbi:YceH family protein [Shewanella donghaensis]|uniref:YceH family protein n=1 Tax=Shewanella donghaensis TaxID=238836 RepID=UPI0011844EC7|nr:YceH family protein [Shewanella donghaensis]